MSGWALWLVTGLYLVQGAILLAEGRAPQALILGGYVVANLGLIWSLAR